MWPVESDIHIQYNCGYRTMLKSISVVIMVTLHCVWLVQKAITIKWNCCFRTRLMFLSVTETTNLYCMQPLEKDIQIYYNFYCKNNADVHQCNDDEESPLHVACNGGRKYTIGNIYDGVSQCEQEDGMSSLPVACDIYLFSNQIQDINTFDERYPGHIESLELLIAWNAAVRMCDKKGQTLLDIAYKSQSVAILNLFGKHLYEILNASQ